MYTLNNNTTETQEDQQIPSCLDTKGPTQQGELETVWYSCWRPLQRLSGLQPARPPKAQQEPTWQLVSTDSPAHKVAQIL